MSTAGDLVEPSEGEKKNGWTAETLTAWLKEEGKAHERLRAEPQLRRTPQTKAISEYDVLKW